MRKTILIVHGLNGSDGEHWQNKLYNKLLEKGENVLFPQLPQREKPDYNKWKIELENNLKIMKGEKIVICHSMGAFLWIRYSQEKEMIKPDRIILAAPPSVNEAYLIGKNFEIDKFDLKKLKNSAENLKIVASNNDHYCVEGAINTYAISEKIDYDLLSDEAGHINIESGYGEWDSIYNWIYNKNNRITEKEKGFFLKKLYENKKGG